MKTFLISPCNGGYKLTENAALYLDWKKLQYDFKNVDGEYFEKQSTLSQSYQKDIDDMESFKSHVKMLEYSDIHVWTGMHCYRCIATTYIHKDPYGSNRDDLIPLVELLEYQYEELDKLNDSCQLRLIKVPDDAPVYIDHDPEYLFEHLATKTPYYPHPFDEYDRFKYVVNKFFAEVWNGEAGDFEFKEVQFAVNEKYAMARCKDSFILLQKVQFYNKKPTFEIIDFKGQDQSVFTPRITTSVVYKDQLEEFVNLYMNLINDR